MINYLNPKDIGLDEQHDRENLSVWVSSDDGVCFRCATCKGYHIGKPTLYCGGCGALMANMTKVQKEYEHLIAMLQSETEVVSNGNVQTD